MSDAARPAGGPDPPADPGRVPEPAGSAPAPPAARPSSRPSIVAEVTGEITPGSAPVWQPGSYAEWEARARLTTSLAVWEAQATDERKLRRTFAAWIFILITVQIVAGIGIVVANGLGRLHVDVEIAKLLIPSVVAEVLGLGYLVTKYLFSLPVRHSLDALAHGAAPNGGATGAAPPTAP